MPVAGLRNNVDGTQAMSRNVFAPHQIAAMPVRTKIDEVPYLKGMGKTRPLLLRMSVPMARFLH